MNLVRALAQEELRQKRGMEEASTTQTNDLHLLFGGERGPNIDGEVLQTTAFVMQNHQNMNCMTARPEPKIDGGLLLATALGMKNHTCKKKTSMTARPGPGIDGEVLLPTAFDFWYAKS